MAEEAKARGNAAMSAQRYDEAIAHYSEAIKLDSNNYLYYSNRSAAYANIGKFHEALADGEKTVELNPSWGKGYSRKGFALFKLGNIEDAKKAYELGLEKEPNNAPLKQALMEIENSEVSNAEAGLGKLFDAATIDRVLGSPEFIPLLEQPDFKLIIQDIKSNPSSISKYVQDPRVMKLFQAVLQSTLGANFPREPPSQQPPQQDIPKEEVKKETKEVKQEPKVEEVKEPETEEEKNKKLALEEKNRGNELYKQRKFDEAIEHYTRAIEIDPAEMAFLTNRAAAYFESKRYEECIKNCEEAIDVGRSHYASFELIAKAFARIGASYHKLGQLDKAIEAYKTSLTEYRVRDVQQTLKKLELEKEELDRKAYLSPEIAQQEKEKGNQFFKENKFPEAIAAYTEAIKRDPTCAALYSNRAAAYAKLAEFGLGLKDCEQCLELDPSFIKAYKRKASIHLFRKEFHKAIDAYKAALAIAPNDQELIDGQTQVQFAIQNFAMTATKEEKEARAKRSMEDPEIRAILQDPVMTQVLQSLSGQGDRKAGQELLKEVAIYEKLDKLIAAGVVGGM